MTPAYCLCPTYRRPACLIRSLYCFMQQTYPNRHLLIWDDAGMYTEDKAERVDAHDNSRWSVRIITSPRFNSLPEKFNALAGLAPSDSYLAVWEDDDLYLPWHLSFSTEAMLTKPAMVLSNYPEMIVLEPAYGRFHASLAFHKSVWWNIQGWPLTKRADFDQQMIHALQQSVRDGEVYDSFAVHGGVPSYLFRWSGGGAYHGQGWMKSADDEEWYDRVPNIPLEGDDQVALELLRSNSLTDLCEAMENYQDVLFCRVPQLSYQEAIYKRLYRLIEPLTQRACTLRLEEYKHDVWEHLK